MISTLSLLTLSLCFVFVPGHPVQEDGRNSSEDHTNPHSDRDLVQRSQAGTSFTSTAPVGQEVRRGTEGGKGRLYERLEEWTSGLQSVSSPSSQYRGLLHPTSPLLGLTVAGRADRETHPLPEEEPNNRADTSGVAHLTDGPMSATEGTHPYFQHTLSAETPFHTSNTETNSSNELLQTQMALKHATASSSSTTDVHKYTLTQTSKPPVTTQDHPTVSSSSVPPLTSSPSELSSWTTWESGTTLSQRGGAVSGTPEEKLLPSWRSQRSTDKLNSDLTSGVTSDPLKSQTEPQHGDSSSARTDTEPIASSPSQGPSRTYSSTTHDTGLSTAVGTVEAASFQPNSSLTDSFVSDATGQTAAFEPSDEFENSFTSSTQGQTNSLQSTESVTQSPTPHTSSPFTQTGKEETQTATQSTQRNVVTTTNTISSSPNIQSTQVDDWTFSASPSTTRAALTLGDVVQNSATTGSTADTETYTQSLSYTHLRDNSPTDSPTPVTHLSSSTSAHSSTPSYTLQPHTTFSGSSHLTHTSSPLPSTTTESAAQIPLIDHKTMPIPSQTSTVKSTSSRTPPTQSHLPLPSSTSAPATHKQSHDYITTTHTTTKSDSGHEKEDESWFTSSTTTHTPTAGPPSWTTPHPSKENQPTLTSSVLTSVPTWSSTTSHTPKFYIVPDQPAAIRGIVHICV